VPVCQQCGTDNPDVARFCLACGSPLQEAPPPREHRKIVTIVFSDLKGSTAMGEKLDSESLREVMTRYFDAMRAELERHGGVVEKFIGDAIMAVFGLPTLHEDDALRAVRAAAAMQKAQAVLNEQLERQWGVRLTVRTGVNTGEVVAGDPSTGQRLVTGDTVNVAARLEQAAGAQEVLLGELTYRLVRDAVEVEPVEPLELKGKAERVPAYRLVSVTDRGEGWMRRRDAPMVGREAELALLESTFEDALAARRCRLVTVFGDAGVGKSRLNDEFLQTLGPRAQVLRGRCLSYGEGITFWPLAEAIRMAAAIREDDPPDVGRDKLASLAGEENADAAARVASAIGLSMDQFAVDELFWGARRLLEALGRRKPLVVLLDDIHWAEPTFLDLVEHLVDSVQDAPLLLLCPSRHDLLEQRSGWAERPGATGIFLEPLTAADTERIVENLLGRAGIAEHARARIAAAAEGNPLFVEQLLSMLIDEELLRFEDGCWVAVSDLGELAVPPTIQALLAARLDRLVAEERAVLEPASVIGHVFAQDAVAHLAPDEVRPRIAVTLAGLTGKQFVRPDLSAVDEVRFRFNHALIREATYGGLLKRARAVLHERFVAWADRVNRERGREIEYEEILGYHLEQAHRYLSELGPLDDHGREVGLSAATRLASAGRRAFARGDMPAAASLLQRAAALFPEDDRRRLELLPGLAEALMEIGEFARAESFVEQAVEQAGELEETRLWADAVVTRLLVRHHVADDLERWSEDVVKELEQVIPELERISAHDELAKAWRLLGYVHGSVLRYREAVEAVRQAIHFARLAGDRRLEARATAEYAAGLRDGPTPVSEAIRECEDALGSGLADRQAEAFVLCSLARLHAMQGDFAQARELIARAGRMRDELGANVIVPVTSLQSSRVETLAGDLQAAERDLRREYEKLSAMGFRYALPLVAALLSRAVWDQGRYGDASQWYASAMELADEDDVETMAILRCVQARKLAHDGDLRGAEREARAAVEALARIEAPDLRGDCLVTLADVLAAAARPEDTRAALEEAHELYAFKGNLVSAERIRALALLVGVAEQPA
jgi:class 3 adenylate cyclase/tetratricopeptide (TPR) repeat protein